MIILKAGSLALWDSFAGMLAIRILSIHWYDKSKTLQTIDFEITARNNAIYKRGQKCSGNGLHIVPRNIKFKRGTFHQRYIVPAFQFQNDARATNE